MWYKREVAFFGPRRKLQFDEDRRLTAARFSGYRVSNKIIKKLLREKELWSLEFSGCKFQSPPDEWIAQFGEQLTFYTMDWIRGNAALCQELSHLTKLYSLRLFQNKLTDKHFKHYQAPAGLHHLCLAGNNIQGECFSILKDSHELEELNVLQCPLLDESFRHLKSCRSLKKVGLDNTPISDNALQHLAELPNLERLNCEHTNITSAAVVHINRMRKLTSLTCGNTKIDQRFFVNLDKQLPLETIYTNVKMDRIVIDELTKIRTLRHLVVISPCDEQLEAKIVDALPEACVEFFPEEFE
jgi:hypothetical protein